MRSGCIGSPLIDPANGSDMGMPLLGVVDLVLPGSQGGLHIVDFKTAARSTAPPEVVHEIQLTSYAYLCR